MILDVQNTYNITVGESKRRPQEDDSAVVVPNVVMPVVLSLRPTIVGQPSSLVQSESCLDNNFLARINQPAAVGPIMLIAAGLWELELTLTTSFDYTPALPLTNASDVYINLLYHATNSPLLSRFPIPGSFTDYNRLRILLDATAEISLGVPATGVAQNLAAKAIVNAIRIL